MINLINALGGPVLTIAMGVGFCVWVICWRIARESQMATKTRHAETTAAEANRHSEKMALIRANDPKTIEGVNKQLPNHSG